MSLISRMRKQTAVYWALKGAESGGIDYDNFGRPQLTDPIEIKCRWEKRVEEFVDPKGTRVLSNAVVYVDQDVDLGGVLMLGELIDVTDETNPKENDNAWEIRGFGDLPNLRATEFLKTAFL